VFAGGSHGRGMVSADGWKYVRFSRKSRSSRRATHDRTSGGHYYGEELFHLDEDPGETRNLAEAEPQKLAEMRALLVAREQAMGEGFVTQELELDADTERQLKALGYLGKD
jgi:arylsulfatase A-like enzyme